MGSNGSGKSTRTYFLVNYLISKFEYSVIRGKIERKGKEPKQEDIGFLFENGWFVLGRFAKGGTQWVSLDTAMFSNWEQRLEKIPALAKQYPEITTIFMEGYFNNRSKRGDIPSWEANGCDEVHLIASYYDDITEFLQRTNERTGKTRGLDWAENSSGWSDNELFKTLLIYYKNNMGASENNLVKHIDFKESRDALVKMYFNENWEIVNSIKETAPSKDTEWF